MQDIQPTSATKQLKKTYPHVSSNAGTIFDHPGCPNLLSRRRCNNVLLESKQCTKFIIL